VGGLVAGCGQEQIQVYQAPKEQPPEAHSPGDGHDHGAAPHGGMGAGMSRSLTFKMPAGWQEKPATQMRAAQFVVPGKDGMDVDVSVIPLPGMSAGREDIMNIWREQLRLPPADKGATETGVQQVEIGDGKGDLYDLVSTDALINNQYKLRITTAVVEKNGASWFIKMTGPDELVAASKPAFLAFLKSLAWGDAPAAVPEAQPATAATGTGGTGPSKWPAPAHWKEQSPPGPMLTAKFVVGGAGGKQAEVTISSLGGDGGGILPNLNRWRGQLMLKPVEAAELPKLATVQDLSGQKVSVFDMEGTSAKTGDPARMVVLSVAIGGQTWFYKLLGDAGIVGAEKANFLTFVGSVKYSNAQ
jgi:hypothetical protein